MAGGGPTEPTPKLETPQDVDAFVRKMREKHPEHKSQGQPRTLHQRFQGKWWYRVPPNHSKPVYQFLGIGLGASMWFWVRFLASYSHPAYSIPGPSD